MSSDDRAANDAVELGHLGLNTLPIPVLVTRTADDTILYVNPTYTARYGFDSSDVVGRSATELHHAPEDRATALGVLSRGLQGPVETRLSNEAGECRWAEAYLSPTDSWGQPAVVTVFHDIGARKEAEEELSRYAAEMQEIARDDGGTIIPMFTNFVYARNKKVQHGENLAASWAIDGARGASRWWFES